MICIRIFFGFLLLTTVHFLCGAVAPYEECPVVSHTDLLKEEPGIKNNGVLIVNATNEYLFMLFKESVMPSIVLEPQEGWWGEDGLQIIKVFNSYNYSIFSVQEMRLAAIDSEHFLGRKIKLGCLKNKVLVFYKNSIDVTWYVEKSLDEWKKAMSDHDYSPIRAIQKLLETKKDELVEDDGIDWLGPVNVYYEETGSIPTPPYHVCP